ncbi:hypothetical protein EW146_g9106 [Bondarzewia mesenterica]|uniref:Carboxypeptidase n=1 Tax=Bondarzewia mesenterica TaxID=1095465 RepID=A0A4S4LAZ1_9AGAM|nr:hypothetical protein EW146_g9106 [Bondarzewia mesenterica]
MFKLALPLVFLSIPVLGQLLALQEPSAPISVAYAPESEAVVPDPITGRCSNEYKVMTMHLSSIASGQEFTVLDHPRFPAHRVRIKKAEFCDPTVNVYTGYLDVDQGAKHLFFYFFESRRNPDAGTCLEEPTRLLFVHGPSHGTWTLQHRYEQRLSKRDHMESVLLEQRSEHLLPRPAASLFSPCFHVEYALIPGVTRLILRVGVGFSYAEHGETVETTEEAAQNIAAFISIFFETFNQFKGRPLHLAGESYGGRYLPVFASEIWDQNQYAEEEGRPLINLQSVVIGNGITDISTLYAGRYEIECGTAALDVPFQFISTCVRMKKALPRCEQAMNKYCVKAFDEMSCRAAVDFCNNELSSGYWASGRNVYDISKMCLGDDLCYLENIAISDFLNQPALRESLGVESPNEFHPCSHAVGTDFDSHMDKYAAPTQYYVAGLLERGIRVLIYAGTYDWQCNWVANKLWVDKLEWSGHDGYHNASWHDWTVEGAKAGETKSWGNLTFATVRGAGHMMSTFLFFFLPDDFVRTDSVD